MPDNKILKFIESAQWQFAKTMPDIPHEYIVIGNYPEKAKEIKSFISEINKNGYTKSFFGKEYKYLNINNYKYWVIKDIINRTKILEK